MGTGGVCGASRCSQYADYDDCQFTLHAGVIVPLTSTESNEEAIREISSLVFEVTYDIVYLVRARGWAQSFTKSIYLPVCCRYYYIFCYSSQSRTAKQG